MPRLQEGAPSHWFKPASCKGLPPPMVPNPSLLPAPTLSPTLNAFLCKPQAYTQPVLLLFLLV